jgi:hypothetical protein
MSKSYAYVVHDLESSLYLSWYGKSTPHCHARIYTWNTHQLPSLSICSTSPDEVDWVLRLVGVIGGPCPPDQ